MAGAKLQSVKETAKFLVQQLSPQDKLSVVTFETDVSCVVHSQAQFLVAKYLLRPQCIFIRCAQVAVNFALREMTAEGKAAAELAIDRIVAGGGTNLSGGLFKGIDQHQQGAAQRAPMSSEHDDPGTHSVISLVF